jgi:hypothetical protein
MAEALPHISSAANRSGSAGDTGSPHPSPLAGAPPGVADATIRDLIHNQTARVDFAALDRGMQCGGTNDHDHILEHRPPDQRTEDGKPER